MIGSSYCHQRSCLCVVLFLFLKKPYIAQETLQKGAHTIFFHIGIFSWHVRLFFFGGNCDGANGPVAPVRKVRLCTSH